MVQSECRIAFLIIRKIQNLGQCGFKDPGNAAAVRPPTTQNRRMTDHKPWKIDGQTKSCKFCSTLMTTFGGPPLPSLAASFGELPTLSGTLRGSGAFGLGSVPFAGFAAPVTGYGTPGP
jgi:hypothetical protein